MMLRIFEESLNSLREDGGLARVGRGKEKKWFVM
jgi:hypothetical protein